VKQYPELEGKVVNLGEKEEDHINDFHPEINEENIKETLLEPDEVRKSKKKVDTKIYWKKRLNRFGKTRYTGVVVKNRADGKWIDTAYTTSRIKKGDLIYPKQGEEK